MSDTTSTAPFPSSPVLLLVGAGRVGMNLLRYCATRGMAIAMVVEPEIQRHPSIRGTVPDAAVLSRVPARLPAGITHVVLAVPDALIAHVAQELRHILTPGHSPLVFHCSGTLGSDQLSPLVAVGCLAGCMHPMQSFHSDDLENNDLEGIGCGIEGSDAFWRAARTFAESLDWHPLRVDAARKVLYHAACVFAGNFTTVLAAVAEDLLHRAATDSADAKLSHLLPMMRTVLARLEKTPPGTALTGPAARGDRETIARHRRTLEAVDPELAELYAGLSELAARVVKGERGEEVKG
ncbi:MAG: DUF2520 domain-containing protein [Bacteroidota bacterium]|nr:DUF2520 domain-containing protein [Bacteroidota bacterium]